MNGYSKDYTSIESDCQPALAKPVLRYCKDYKATTPECQVGQFRVEGLDNNVPASVYYGDKIKSEASITNSIDSANNLP
jgi:hypothetical protein